MDWENFRINQRLKLPSSAVELIYSMISEIDGVKNSWKITQNLLPQTIKRLTHSVIVTSTGASNRIEGNRLTDIEVEDLYKNLKIKKLKTRDEQEIAGYLESLEFIFKNYQDISITESYILKLHDDMLFYSTKDVSHKGSYKSGYNRVEAKDDAGKIVGIIFDPTPPYLVRKEMQELIDWYNFAIANQVKHPLILIANFIFEFLAIHPFQDGNGRISRLLTNILLLQNKYFFVQFASHEKIIEENKKDYYLALNKTQNTWKTNNEDITAWLLFFLKVVKLQSEQAMLLLSEDSLDHLLSEKQLLLWNWAKDINREFSRKDAIMALEFPERTVEYIIKKLINLNMLLRLGQGKSTRYKIKT